jgi:rhamnulokinase
MPLSYHAAIDLGATSGRVILGAWDGRALTLTEAHRFPNAVRALAGHEYWDIPTLWQEIITGLRAAVQALPQGAKLASIGVDTWACDHVLVDAAGAPVYPFHAYRDSRSLAPLQALLGAPAAHAQLYSATGVPALFYNTSLHLSAALSAHPALSALATRCLFLPDYFNFLLSGKMVNEVSVASTSQLLAVSGSILQKSSLVSDGPGSARVSRAGLGVSPKPVRAAAASAPAFSTHALDHFGIPPRWFSPPVLAGSRLGRVKGLDFLAATEVIVVPMPAAPGGTDLFLSSGTWSIVGFESATPVLGPEALAAQISNPRKGDGTFMPETNVIGLWLLEGTFKDFAIRPATAAAWDRLLSAAEKLPAPAALLEVGDAAFANPPSMRAAIDAQLKRRRLKPPADLAGYTRLICASLGQGHADCLRNFERLAGKTFTRILMTGGGAKNRLLCQATADAAGIPVVSFALEGTAVGNLANQLIALRRVKNLATFRALLAPTLKPTTYTPQT